MARGVLVTAATEPKVWPEHGDYVQKRNGRSNVHIADRVMSVTGGVWVVTACRRGWSAAVLAPADDYYPRQCQKCWDSM